MKSMFPVPILVLLLFFTLTATAVARGKETGFLNRTVKVGGETYRFQVYVPREWNSHQKWPVVLFLHGAGERGSDGLVQTEVGLGSALRRFNDRFPAVVVMPQCRKDVWWPADAMQAQALAAMEQAIKEFRGDRSRLYLTGLSMGGYGTWAMAAKHPGIFAALTPICGGVRLPERLKAEMPSAIPADAGDPYLYVAKKIGKTPVWIFHGGSDTVVPVEESRKMNESLQASGGQVKFTEYPEVGHNSWDKAYADPEWAKWLFSQKLGK